MRVEAGEVAELLIRLRLPKGEATKPNETLEFDVQSLDDEKIHAREESRFIAPFPTSGNL